jgi:NitT/TauT family transport system substrate-binding protein
MSLFTREAILRGAMATAAATIVPRSIEAQNLTTMRIGAALDDSTTPLLFADHAGYFKRNGLAVEITKLQSGSAVAAAVIGGSLDLGKSSFYSIIAAHARGIPFQFIAPTGSYSSVSPDAALIVAASSPIRTASDLNGKILGVASLQDLNMVATEAWVDKNGGSSASLKFVELPPPAVLESLMAGRIAASPVQDPLLSTIMASGNARVIGYANDAIAKNYQSAGVFGTIEWVAHNRDTVERFARAMRDANAYLGKHEEEGVPLIAQFIGITSKSASSLHHPGRPSYLVAGEIQPLIDVTAAYKIIPRAFPAQEIISPSALQPPR